MRRHPVHLAFAAAALLTLGLAPPAAAGSAATRCLGAAATIIGTAGRDKLQGTPGRDVIAGLGSKDEIHGLGGDDLLCGSGEGANAGVRDKLDTIYGGPGDDRLDGG
ncbi:MAG TPA: calcium-binding protein, partial [Actinomycetota bacterium]|nr:calcium-binding protein [Actinomycetota bacterium]